jgi:hypothetical protein
MSHLVLFLLACSPATPSEVPEPAPVEAPEPSPEPQPDIAELHTVTLSFGKACEEPAEGEPVDAAQVEAMLKKAGIVYATVKPAAACDACGTCPRLAVEVETTADPDKVKAALRPMPEVPKDGRLTLDIGRKCAQPVDGAPTTMEEVLAAFAEAGIEVKTHEARMACTACGCPELSLDITVDPADAAKALQLAHPWTPPPEQTGGSLPTKGDDAAEGKPKGSLP